MRLTKNESNRNLFFIQLVIVLMGAGTGTTAPAIPLLGESLGASLSEIGFFMTGYSMAYALMTIISGSLSDRLGRKKLLLSSIVAAFIASTGYMLAENSNQLFIFRTLEGLSWGTLWPVAEAIVADNTPSSTRGRAMGSFSALYGLGVAMGSLLGGFLMQYINIKAVLPVFPILSVLVIFFAMVGIKDSRNLEHSEQSSKKVVKNYGQEIKKIWPVCYAAFAYSGFLYSLWGLLSLIAKDANVSLMGIGLIFALFWLCRLIFMVGASKVQTIFGSKRVLIFGIFLVTISQLLLILTSHYSFLVMAVILGGLGTGIAFPIVITIVADSASPGYRGFALGFMELTAALGMIFQTGVAGLLAEWGGTHLTYLLSFVLCVIAIISSSIFIKTKQEKLTYDGIINS